MLLLKKMCVLCSNAKLNQYKEQLFLPGVYKEVLEIAGLLNSSWVCSLDAEEGRTEHAVEDLNNSVSCLVVNG